MSKWAGPKRQRNTLEEKFKVHLLNEGFMKWLHKKRMDDCTTHPALQSASMSFLSGNLSVLSGSRETLYTTQHSRYYELYYFTIIYICFLWIYRIIGYIWMHLWKYSLLAFYRVYNLSSPRYEADSSLALSFQNSLISKSIPPLNIFTVPDWLNFKFHYFLIGPKVEILNTVTRLAPISETLFHCRHPCEPLHASYWFS